MIDSFIEDGEISRVVERAGPDRVPTLSRLDPYADHVFDAYWCELMNADINRLDMASLTSSEREVMTTLARWSSICIATSDHRIRFSGD